jgi:hypothetical protein
MNVGANGAMIKIMPILLAGGVPGIDLIQADQPLRVLRAIELLDQKK